MYNWWQAIAITFVTSLFDRKSFFLFLLKFGFPHEHYTYAEIPVIALFTNRKYLFRSNRLHFIVVGLHFLFAKLQIAIVQKQMYVKLIILKYRRSSQQFHLAVIWFGCKSSAPFLFRRLESRNTQPNVALCRSSERKRKTQNCVRNLILLPSIFLIL